MLGGPLSGGQVEEGLNLNKALQEGRRNAADKRATQADLPTGAYVKSQPMVPSASNAGQPGNLFKGLAGGFAKTFREQSSETGRAQVRAVEWGVGYVCTVNPGGWGDNGLWQCVGLREMPLGKSQ
jgi:hypothetical protein